MRHISVDIETYSATDIKKAGAYKYALDPDFDVLLIAWAEGNAPVQLIDLTAPGGRAHADEFFSLLARPDVTMHAYNAAFEWWCLTRYARKHGIHLPEDELLNRTQCTMAHALYCGLPAGLAATGEAIGLPQDKRKLGIGGALIRAFCMPQKADKAHPDVWRRLPQDEPEKWRLFGEYCRQDVEAERSIEARLSAWPVPEKEWGLWRLDVRTNAAGMAVDPQLVEGAQTIGEAVRNDLTEEARFISGLSNPRSVQQLLKWLNEEIEAPDGEELTDLQKGTVADLLKKGVPSDRAERMLEIRQLLGKTSTTKYAAMQNAMCPDNRVRGLLQYYGANRTGRWAGRLVQVQNLPRNYLAQLDFARECVRKGHGDVLEACFGDVPDTLSQLIRTAFVPREGHEFAIADYSAIEARVVAWLAGEKWALDVFKGDGKIYEATAGQMFGVDPALIRKGNPEYALRQKGKVATLALGYGGGESALIAMGALKMGLTEDELPDIKFRWRQANPRIVEFWSACDRAAFAALQHGSAQVAIPQKGVPPLVFRKEAVPGAGSYLTIDLPAGRKLFYAQPFLAPARLHPDRTSLHYYGNSNGKKWAPLDTWGGKLVENITQAVARDCLADLLLRIQAAGMTTVAHVHDEVIVEAPKGGDTLERLLELMEAPPDWAHGLPLRGAGFRAEYYQKD